MTLKQLCKALGWHRIRRWKHFVKEVKHIECEYEQQRSKPQSISPYFDSLFGDWRPNPTLVSEVMRSMATRTSNQLWEADHSAAITRSRYRGGQGLVLVDEHYPLTTLDLAERIIKDTPVEQLRYIAETQDCDDFARILRSLLRVLYGVDVMVVISISWGHAFIAWPLITGDRVEWRFLEPQNDRWLHVFIGRHERTASGRTREGQRGDVSEALIV